MSEATNAMRVEQERVMVVSTPTTQIDDNVMRVEQSRVMIASYPDAQLIANSMKLESIRLMVLSQIPSGNVIPTTFCIVT